MNTKKHKNDKKSLKSTFILMGFGTIVGAVIGYYLWYIDFL